MLNNLKSVIEPAIFLYKISLTGLGLDPFLKALNFKLVVLFIVIGFSYNKERLSGSSPSIVYLYSGFVISETTSTFKELENRVWNSGFTKGILSGTLDAKSSSDTPKYILLLELAEISLVNSRSLIVL